MTFFIGLLLILALVLIWIAVSKTWETDHPPGRGWGLGTRYFLVLLRLAIGWHFLVEGLEKFSPSWSSEAYLREASGPLAPWFRELVGDRLVDELALEDGNLSPSLKARWDAYLDAFIRYYDLNEEQQEQAKKALEQVESATLTRLSVQPKRVEKVSSGPPPLLIKMTMAERLDEYRRLEEEVRKVEAGYRAQYGPEAFDKLQKAKADLNQWRAGLRKDLALIYKEMKRALETVLLAGLQEKLTNKQQQDIHKAHKKIDKEVRKEAIDPEDWDGEERSRDKADEALLAEYRKVLAAVRASDKGFDPFTARVFETLIEKRGKNQPGHEPLPFAVSRPLSTWQLVDFSDPIVKYGLVWVGVGLLGGILTRTACLAGAGFLLLFFLAMPPLPGWPANPRAEGHYLYLNKNIIEMLALLALATTRSGRWVGLDGLLLFVCPWCRRGALRQPEDSAVNEKAIGPPVSPVPAVHDITPVPSSPAPKEISHGP